MSHSCSQKVLALEAFQESPPEHWIGLEIFLSWWLLDEDILSTKKVPGPDTAPWRRFLTWFLFGIVFSGGAVDLVGSFQGFLLLHHVCCGFNRSKLDWISPPVWPCSLSLEYQTSLRGMFVLFCRSSSMTRRLFGELECSVCIISGCL